MKRILLIDGNNTAWRAFHKYRGLKHGKTNVAIIFGLPSIVNGVINRFKPNRTVVVWDGGKNKHRLEEYPDYKAKRKFNPDYDEFIKQKAFTMDMLNKLGVPQVHNLEMEADDYIYMLSRIYKKKGYEVIILSSDKDFNQLICDQVRVYDGVKKLLLHKDNLKLMKGYKPKQVVDYLIMDGDDSDNIKGYPGMGEKRCGDFFKKYGSIKKFLESGDKHTIIKREVLLEVVKRNTILIDLAYFYKTYLKGRIKIQYYNNQKNPKINKAEFLRICRKLKITTFTKKPFLKNYE